MSVGRKWVWLGTALTWSALGGAAGCGDDDSAPPDSGSGGLSAAGASTGGTSTGGRNTAASGGEGDRPPPPPMEGGSGGEGGEPARLEGGSGGEGGGDSTREGGRGGEGGSPAFGCEQTGYEVFARMPGAVVEVAAWPEFRRIVLLSSNELGIFEPEATGLAVVTVLAREQLGATIEETIRSFAVYGDGLVVLIESANGQRLIRWTEAAGAEELPELPSLGFEQVLANFQAKRVALASSQAVLVLHESDGDWEMGDPFSIEEGRIGRLLALQSDAVVIGVDENNFPDEGGSGGAGGAGQAAPARIERRGLDGETIESHATVGNPQMTLPLDGESESYLLAETNSFWGSYEAALERYDAGSSLVKLAKVPVRSSGDAEDGAFDLAALGERLFVANCESGLLTTDLPASGATELPPLTGLEGPWSDDGVGVCAVRAVEALDDVLIVGARSEAFFVRFCSED